VLEHQSEQPRAFLLETSVLQRLNGPLCDAVTGRTGSQALLVQVERDGLFLLPLDEMRGWWRYHQLFADLLRARLQQQPDRAVPLHRNAAAWYAGHELADDAIGHAVAAGEMTWAARLIEEHFDERCYLQGEVSTVRRWLAALPPELAGARARLLLAQARLALLDGGLAEAEELLDSGRRSRAIAVVGRRPAFGCRRGLHRRLDLPCPLPGPAGSGPAGRGGDDLPPDAGDHGATSQAGRPGRRRRPRQPGRGCLPAERARHRAPAFTEGIALCRQLAYTAPLAAGLVTLAWIRQAGGDQAGALDAIGEAGGSPRVPR
jgi:hypothetical protein